ncbi:MAG: NifB/NifX family molybdenum-iron cluster-binding protein [bacterium]
MWNRFPEKSGRRIHKTCIAAPCYAEEVAPCFDTASRFRYWEIESGIVVEHRELEVEGSEGIARVRWLKDLYMDVLICNGISEHLREMIEEYGCLVIYGVVGSASDALFRFLAGRIQPQQPSPPLKPELIQPHTADLVIWTEDLFGELGWQLRRVIQNGLFPIDLLAQRDCPVCGKRVRAAICCGAHAYQIEEEVREFRRITADGYNTRVYVHYALPGVFQTCCDFDIELLDPQDFTDGCLKKQSRKTALPPLRRRIEGHEALNEGM